METNEYNNDDELNMPDILRDFLPEGSILTGIVDNQFSVLVPNDKLNTTHSVNAHSRAYAQINKEIPYFKKEFDIPQNFKFPVFLSESYWNKKIEKHGSIQDAMYNMYGFGAPAKAISKTKSIIENLPTKINLFDTDNSSLEHKMNNMKLVGRSIILPRDCTTDLEHYSALQQTLNSIKPGETSSYSTLTRTLSELKKNWG